MEIVWLLLFLLRKDIMIFLLPRQYFGSFFHTIYERMLSADERQKQAELWQQHRFELHTLPADLIISRKSRDKIGA
jgi:hypothetical protein